MGIRSLFAGVSGLRNFQQQLDIIGNNIANSNTAGYKSSRITFQDLLSQTSRGATASSDTIGGTNPLQFGLGASVGSIDLNLNQGTLLTTGRQLDLAISGNGFFKVSNGDSNFYTRNGALDVDEQGYLVSSTTGYMIQGFGADQGVLDTTAVGNIQIPVGIVLPAEATDTVDLVGNLDSTAEQVGSIHESEALLATELAANDSDLDGLYAVGTLNSRIAGMQQSITNANITSTAGNGVVSNFTLTYVAGDATNSDGNFTSVADLVQEINSQLVAAGSTFTCTQAADGSIAINHGASAATGTFVITSNNSSLNSALSTVNSTTYAAAGQTHNSDQFTHTATEADLAINLRSAAGASLGLDLNDTMTINGSVGGDAITAATSTILASTTYGNICDSIATALNITNADHNVEVSAGKVRITGDGGTDYTISGINITSTDTLTATPNAVFNGVFDSSTGNWSKVQDATDTHTTSFVAYDSDGVQHTVSIKFNIRDSSGGVGQWVYDVHATETSTGTDEGITPSTGSIQFAGDGSLVAFSPAQITIYPTGTGNPIQLTMDPGTVGAYNGLVAFENNSSARFANLTGYASGELEDITVNAAGVLTGSFTNGQNMTLAQLVLSNFDNPEGLEKVGSNMYRETLNSGVASDAAPGSGGRGELIASSLEGSNVDLAEEFVNLIQAQRGFQTNARMITTANDILGELVNLVR